MPTAIYINLAVKDLPRTKAFFSQLGFTFDAQFSNENGLSMVVDEKIIVMLLKEEYFTTFTGKPLAVPHTAPEVILALQVENRAQVDTLVEKALAAGGKPSVEGQDLGWMYSKDFEDLDGHLWEFFYMDPGGPPSP